MKNVHLRIRFEDEERMRVFVEELKAAGLTKKNARAVHTFAGRSYFTAHTALTSSTEGDNQTKEFRLVAGLEEE